MAQVLANKAKFLENYLSKHRELGKRQREYKKMLSSKVTTRKETIVEASHENSIEKMEEEKNELRAQIWVAGGRAHLIQNERNLKLIKCHVDCQEKLADEISSLKVSIVNMDREIERVDKRAYALNRLIIPDQQQQAHVAKTRKRMMLLENALEESVRRECLVTAKNAQLREQIIRLLNYRVFFNDTFLKMVQQLNSDKKYLMDTIEHVLTTFEGCIDVYEKSSSLQKHEIKDREMRKIEMQVVMRKLDADTDNKAFLGCKGKQRVLADLQPKEYARREKFRREHNLKINLYKSVLEKIFNYTHSSNVEEVIEKFQQQESLYYSFFKYASEMSYHITLLNKSVERLYEDIVALKKDNKNTLQEQLETIATMEKELDRKQQSNTLLKATRENNDERLQKLLQGVETLCDMATIDTAPFSKLLGDNNHVNLVNVRRFLKILEQRVLRIIACVYVNERKSGAAFEELIVKRIDKVCEKLTNIDDIVLPQQLPECAEGEAFNVGDYGDEQAKEKLYEKIAQPEMQYRLQSLSQCRLHRPRKRDM